MNPLALIIQILQIVATQFAGKAESAVKQIGVSAGTIATRITEITIDFISGDLPFEDVQVLLNQQFDELKIAIDAALATGEIAAEQLPNDILTAVKDLVFGAIGKVF